MLNQNGERKLSFSYDINGKHINNSSESAVTVLNLSYPLFKGWGSAKLNLYCSRFAAALKSYCRKISVSNNDSNRLPVIINMRSAVFTSEASLSLCFEVSQGRNLPYRFASVWSLKNGWPLSLIKVTGLSRRKLIEQLVLKTEERISRGLRIYYGDYKRLIHRRFNKDNWYLGDSGISIFFQPGEIAPVIEGIQVFSLEAPAQT